MPNSLFGLFIFLDLFIWERTNIIRRGRGRDRIWSSLRTEDKSDAGLHPTYNPEIVTWAESRVGGLTNCANQVPQFGLFCLTEPKYKSIWIIKPQIMVTKHKMKHIQPKFLRSSYLKMTPIF